MAPALSPTLATFLARLQKDCLPGVWAKGMGIARAGSVRRDPTRDPDEIVLRIPSPDRAVTPKVTLWPEDDDAYCDCGDRNELCAHIAAAAIAIKSGQLEAAEARAAEREGDEAPVSRQPTIRYRLLREGGKLRLERTIEYAGREIPIPDTLVALVGGISSGRVELPPVPATREDFAVDAALSQSTSGGGGHGVAADKSMARLLPHLARLPLVTLDGQPVRISGAPTGLRAQVSELGAEQASFRVRATMDPTIREIFSNGAALCESASGSGTGAPTALTLKPLLLPSLSEAERRATSPEGQTFKTETEIAWLVSELLPSLERKLPLETLTERLPTPRDGQPRIRLRIESSSDGALVVAPSIDYPDRLEPGEILVRDPQAEARLARKLRNDLHLTAGQATRFNGQDAIDFALKLQNHPDDWALHGKAAHALRVLPTDDALVPELTFTDQGFGLGFGAAGAKGSGSRPVDGAAVIRAWKDGADFVPLPGGGWAKLPQDWLARYGARIAALLEARDHSSERKLPPHLLPELAALAEDLGSRIPEGLRALRDRLIDHAGIPRAELPQDLAAELRDYQRQGIDWLCWLRDSGMGALLADDMGLGKTLQALCALRGRTLVVCPTSVLSAWSEQIARFRPSLKTCTYHGPGRELDDGEDILLTTYTILRIDRERLQPIEWDTIVIDEAQTIKNPQSQSARAVHALRGGFRLALSGTPVENRLEDLWSQFQFVAPGLLGSRRAFLEEVSTAVSRGDPTATQRLRARIRPFLLRRLKREVARELPPRTETTLHCELSEAERELYDSVRAACRREVLEKLESSGATGAFAALEALLRLRQASCHPALVPGAPAALSASTSSKVRLLLETLQESVGLGHRALIFSQWTGLLDLVEPELASARIRFARIDGSTPQPERERIVREFQTSDATAPERKDALLISLKAGGTGLTLTAADHVFLLDPWWNPTTENQAADRAHRIGQENPVLVHRLVARDTVEERVLALQARKAELAGSVLEGAQGTAALTREDWLELLSE